MNNQEKEEKRIELMKKINPTDFYVKDVFIIRPIDEEETGFIITIGEKIADPIVYESYDKAQHAINIMNWDLIGSLITSQINVALNKKEEK